VISIFFNFVERFFGRTGQGVNASVLTFEQRLTQHLVEFDDSWLMHPEKKKKIVSAFDALIDVDHHGELSGPMAQYWRFFRDSGHHQSKITIVYQENTALQIDGTAFTPKSIRIDPDYATKIIYVCQNGNVERYTVEGVLAHELMHALTGASDNVTASVTMDNVALTNAVFEKLGLPKVSHYLASMDESENFLFVGQRFTDGQRIDVAVAATPGSLAVLQTDHVDTSHNGATRDLLIGHEGKDDMLVGGSGDDFLYGAAGADGLYGGAGNDKLYGGSLDAPDDRIRDELFGGDGFDSYYVGHLDSVTDSDGAGEVIFAGKTLSGGLREQKLVNALDISGKLPVALRSWEGTHGERYVLSAKGKTHVLTVSLPNGDMIEINDFSIKHGTLGIWLVDKHGHVDLQHPLIVDLDHNDTRKSQD
jgi:hypothetical protein